MENWKRGSPQDIHFFVYLFFLGGVFLRREPFCLWRAFYGEPKGPDVPFWGVPFLGSRLLGSPTPRASLEHVCELEGHGLHLGGQGGDFQVLSGACHPGPWASLTLTTGWYLGFTGGQSPSTRMGLTLTTLKKKGTDVPSLGERKKITEPNAGVPSVRPLLLSQDLLLVDSNLLYLLPILLSPQANH